ncbi:hypothetical protein pEaSNUABM56_00065 [Erwinia phage pEa_SNUABM_56]|uniref:Uncharacterized protein n=1 Tax=Erwinia phage pEp_SNUABM_01 TaxID=2601643 RepID=A0A5J6DBK4_9CAUD|nr:hypothetical protein HWC63_gp039 [Erwinia phage pEp_SNUABM_01]QEQ94865.1 hypothetical protein pEpSNUABM01_039 [Erwinia phage pEp_SNUABM_01]UYL85110.1 hypothetical protein pEaSNUABM56_00065 [Erwinia phage pEa_SNUABM_56]
MNRGKVRIVAAPRAVPKVVVGETYDVIVRGGKEFILDGYGGYVPLAAVKECEITLENLQ